jgi:hypothetical protein
MNHVMTVGCAVLLASGCVEQAAEGRHQAESMEVRANLPALQQAVQAFAMGERFENGQVVEQGLPPTLPPTPSLASLGETARAWPVDAPQGWRTLGFEPAAPVRYTYSVTTEGNIVRLEATGDLDGDGVRSRFTVEGTYDPASHEYAWGNVVIESEME